MFTALEIASTLTLSAAANTAVQNQIQCFKLMPLRLRQETQRKRRGSIRSLIEQKPDPVCSLCLSKTTQRQPRVRWSSIRCPRASKELMGDDSRRCRTDATKIRLCSRGLRSAKNSPTSILNILWSGTDAPGSSEIVRERREHRVHRFFAGGIPAVTVRLQPIGWCGHHR